MTSCSAYLIKNFNNFNNFACLVTYVWAMNK